MKFSYGAPERPITAAIAILRPFHQKHYGKSVGGLRLIASMFLIPGSPDKNILLEVFKGYDIVSIRKEKISGLLLLVFCKIAKHRIAAGRCKKLGSLFFNKDLN